MKLANIFLALVLTGFFVGSANAAEPTGSWYLQRYDNAGLFYAVMQPHPSNFCFLTQVSVEETDEGSEEAHCRILVRNGRWVLEAALDKSSDADVKCRAQCYK